MSSSRLIFYEQMQICDSFVQEHPLVKYLETRICTINIDPRMVILGVQRGMGRSEVPVLKTSERPLLLICQDGISFSDDSGRKNGGPGLVFMVIIELRPNGAVASTKIQGVPL
ncbi:hypothetical protein L6452_11864 [Arctium lappa]|uniref:Uncharacterized protein n=1 Tax=Arctium lappa TaxID=4217 RepID=A0ACB9DQS3_ARCLA|nr:hypothetical protein L6452_11864 [Arctium lappa]